MRTKKEYKSVSVTEEVYEILVKDKQQFQKTLDGGTWSISDTIIEYKKIIATYMESATLREDLKKVKEEEDNNKEYCNYCQIP